MPVEDAGAPPAPPPSAPQITELAPLDDDAGPGDAAGTGKKWTGGGGGYNTNQLKIRQCCAAMRAQAKVLGASSPEAVQIVGLAAQCDMFASQIGPQGNAPELNQLRQMLKSAQAPRRLPDVARGPARAQTRHPARRQARRAAAKWSYPRGSMARSPPGARSARPAPVATWPIARKPSIGTGLATARA